MLKISFEFNKYIQFLSGTPLLLACKNLEQIPKMPFKSKVKLFLASNSAVTLLILLTMVARVTVVVAFAIAAASAHVLVRIFLCVCVGNLLAIFVRG